LNEKDDIKFPLQQDINLSLPNHRKTLILSA